MKKELLGLVAGLTAVVALVGCSNKSSNKEIAYNDLSEAFEAQNYTFKISNEFLTSIEYYDKTNNAIYTEKHFDERVDKEYVFENEGKVLSVIYTNYKVEDTTYVLNKDGVFEFYQASEFEGGVIDDYFNTGFSLDELFKNNDNKIESNGAIDSNRLGCDERTVEAKNIKNKNNKLTFDLNVIEIQDLSNHAFDRTESYKAELYNLGKTKVEITAEIKADSIKK